MKMLYAGLNLREATFEQGVRSAKILRWINKDAWTKSGEVRRLLSRKGNRLIKPVAITDRKKGNLILVNGARIGRASPEYLNTRAHPLKYSQAAEDTCR